MTKPDCDVAIVGGGLAGLTASILLARQKGKVILFEKNQYPFHKVCGEYVSNEALDFLRSIGLDPFALGASRISKLRLSSPAGKSFSCLLDMGGFGLSRYILDEALFRMARESGVEVRQEKVTGIDFSNHHFQIKTMGGLCSSNFVIGSYGKRAMLDKKLGRSFIEKRSPFMAVKYHLRMDAPTDEIALHVFPRGYCGLVKIEQDKYNLCYLYKRDKKFRDVNALESEVLSQNPALKKIFAQSEFISNEPEVISEVSFGKKSLIENHVFMMGDSAGLIAPLCGNGMAMAMHAAKLLSDVFNGKEILSRGNISPDVRSSLEGIYAQQWNREFAKRLRTGRIMQSLFLRSALSEVAIRSLHMFPPLGRQIIARTHGEPL